MSEHLSSMLDHAVNHALPEQPERRDFLKQSALLGGGLALVVVLLVARK